MGKRFLSLWLLCFLLFAEASSWWMAGGLGPCLITPEHSQQTTNNDEQQDCPTFFAGTLLLSQRGFEWIKSSDNDKAVVAGFTIILAISTIGLWLATIDLYRAGERQIEFLRGSAEVQSRDMQDSIVAANRSAAAAERALAELERPWIFVFGISRPIQGPTGEFFVTYTVANYGKMPAIIEYPRIGFVFEDAQGGPQSPTMVSDDHSLITAQILKVGEERHFREYFPANTDGSVRFEIINQGTSEEILHAVPSIDLGPERIMFFRAIVSYRGPASHGHETGANWLYRDPWDFVTRLDEYNYTN